jgi:SRSO17 transposase
MERRFEVRLDQMLAECETRPAFIAGLAARLRDFVAPFAACLATPEQRDYAQTYVAGLTSDLERKNTESIAYLHDQDRRGLQRFIGEIPWDHRPPLKKLAEQVAAEIGEADAVLVFDPSGFPKKGNESVGVQRQWIGRLGKVENGQLGVYLGYVSRQEHALVDLRLYLPKPWARNRKARAKCGVPREVRYQTRHALALEMLDEKGPLLPHGWIAGDDEFGRSSLFRRDLRERNERYVLAVPSNMAIRDLDGPTAPYGGVGPRPKPRWLQVRTWCAAVPAQAWERVNVRDGEKGPLVVEGVKARVQTRTNRLVDAEEVLVVLRTAEGAGWKYDYHFSNAPFETPLAEFARVVKAEHRIEECIERAKGEAGLADYEVRTWHGWHHHQTLSLLATWFLVRETRQGKKIDPGTHRPASAFRAGPASARSPLHRHGSGPRSAMHPPPSPKRERETAPLEAT